MNQPLNDNSSLLIKHKEIIIIYVFSLTYIDKLTFNDWLNLHSLCRLNLNNNLSCVVVKRIVNSGVQIK